MNEKWEYWLPEITLKLKIEREWMEADTRVFLLFP